MRLVVGHWSGRPGRDENVMKETMTYRDAGNVRLDAKSDVANMVFLSDLYMSSVHKV